MTERNHHPWKYYNVVAVSFLLLTSSSLIAQSANKPTGFIDFNGYYDTRNYSVLTYNILANWPNRVQYFSLTNIQGSQANAELSNYYAEHNIRFAVSEASPFDATVQYVMKSGENNDKIRLGVRWRMNNFKALSDIMKKWNFTYSFNPMFIEYGVGSDPNYFATIEHVYCVKFLKNKFYLAGFADQNFIDISDGLKTNWVTEHQLGYNLYNNFYVVAEYRINEYQKDQETGIGLGVEYKIQF